MLGTSVNISLRMIQKPLLQIITKNVPWIYLLNNPIIVGMYLEIDQKDIQHQFKVAIFY